MTLLTALLTGKAIGFFILGVWMLECRLARVLAMVVSMVAGVLAFALALHSPETPLEQNQEIVCQCAQVMCCISNCLHLTLTPQGGLRIVLE